MIASSKPISSTRAFADLVAAIDPRVSSDRAAQLLADFRDDVLADAESKLRSLVPTSDVPLGISYAADAVRDMRQGGAR